TVPGFKAAADACHQYGAKVSIQLQHAGPEGNSKLTGFPLKAASPIPAAEGREVPEAIGKEELYRLIECYGDAARRAQMSGIDTVEVHCAHGYLVSTFISQRTNNRTDEFGGCFENRMRLARLIIENIRQKTGGNLPIFCRINAGDEVPGGQTVQDAAAVAAYLEQECGVDALHITRAIHLADEFMWTPGVTHGGFNADLVTEIKKAVSIPIIAVGRFTELGGNFRIAAYPTGKGQITEAIRSMIVKCEQAGVDLQTGTEAAVKSILALQPDAVILATGSNPLILKIPGLSECGYVTAQDLLDGKARMGKRVLVVGGGMVGCEAAEFLAERGHQVGIIAMKDVIAGDVVPENRKFMFDNFTRHGVELRPGAKVGQFYPDGVDYALMDGTAGSMREYDSIVLAMGSRSSDPLSEALKETVPQVFAIGEAAKAPGNAALATGDALDAALAI
ncbi:FAD-dependent oxidoreductase, partial [Oscillibacter ruminantium]|uniref:oxidoreductase n=1 Tax=Oscillibacter ruminantium TaxID=1263547 RepID=UPI003322F6EF